MRFPPAAYSLFGYSSGDFEGQWDMFLEHACHPEYHEELKSKVAAALASPNQKFHIEFRIWSKREAAWRWVYAFGETLPMKGADGFHIRGGVQDVHERRAKQKELERSQQEALQTIELQKTVLEQQVLEQMALLRDIQERVDSIIDATSPIFVSAPESCKELAADVYDRVDAFFAESLLGAFDTIMDKMAWYKAIIDSIPFPIAVTDLSGHWMHLNTPGLEAVGAASLRDVFGLHANVWSESAENITHGEKGQVQFSLYHRELQRFFHGQKSGLYDSAGTLMGYIETMQDVTREHEADERTRLMLDAMPFACNFWSRSGAMLDCNKAVVPLFGLPDQQTYLDRFEELSPEFQPNGRNSAELLRENVLTAFEKGYLRFEWLHRTLSGELLPSEVTLVRIAWREDFVAVGYVNDLRELKTARRELDSERLLLKNILDSSPVCMMILVGNKARFVTPFTHTFIGISIGDSIKSYHADQAEYAQVKEELTRNRALNWRPLTITSASDGVRDMLGNAFYTDYYGEEGLVVWLIDVTDMRGKERQLLKARDAAEESTRAKSEFLANMSHEIRTPMNAILGMTHLIQRTELTEKQRDYMDKAERSGRALLRIINDILDFSKIEAGKLEMERLPFSVENVMREVIAVIGDSAAEKGLEVLLSVPQEFPLKVEGDPLRLHQVLLNLASNAVKFTSKGNITMSVTIVSAEKENIVLGFSVSDTGIGLSQSQIDSLFSPFVQADTSTTRQYGGTGLGLAICKRLVELMNGAIWCESLPGSGATFRFTARFGIVEGAPAYSAAFFANLKILLLGNNFEAIALLRPMLQHMGCQVSTAFGLEPAVKLLRQSSGFDLMIMDWWNAVDQVPEAMTYLRKKTAKELPLALLAVPETALGAVKAFRALGIAHILTKPITPSRLFDAISELIGGSNNSGYASMSESSETAESALEKLAPFQGGKILLVEDNPINQMVARELLTIAGMDTDVAENGQEALAKMETTNYALVFMDIQMPVMDGFAAIRAIRAQERFATLPVIAMTALAMHGDREKSLQAGMNDHITKPIDAAELYKALARWMPEP